MSLGAGPGLAYLWRQQQVLQEAFCLLSPYYRLDKIPHNNRSGLSLHLLLPLSSLRDLPACRDGAFRTPLPLGVRRLHLLAASFRCPAVLGKEQVVYLIHGWHFRRPAWLQTQSHVLQKVLPVVKMASCCPSAWLLYPSQWLFNLADGGRVLSGPPQTSRVARSLGLTALGNYLLKIYVHNEKEMKIICMVLSVHGWLCDHSPSHQLLGKVVQNIVSNLCEILEGNNSSKIYSKEKQLYRKYYWRLSP